MKSAQKCPVRTQCLVIGLAVAVLNPSPSFGQLDKRKRGLFPCLIRPDPGCGAGLPAINFGVSAAPPIVTVTTPAGGGHSLGFGSLFGAALNGPRLCVPHSPSFIPPAPASCDRPSFWYPSNNLNFASALSTPNRAVNIVPAPNPQTIHAPPPTDFFVTTGPDTRFYGFRNTPTPRTKGGRSAKSEKEPARPEDAAADSQVPPVPITRRSDAELKHVEQALDRGDQFFRKTDYKAAREEYTRALVLDGEDPGVRIPFGMAEFALGRYSDAARAMRQAACRPPLFDPSSIDLRQAFGKSADFENQLRALESFVDRNPFDGDGLFLLGFIRACTGNLIGARAILDRYLALHDADPATRPFIERVAQANR